MGRPAFDFDQAEVLRRRYWGAREAIGLLPDETPARDDPVIWQWQLCREYGVSDCTMSRLLRGLSYRAPPPPKLRQLTPVQRCAVLWRYAGGGVSCRALGERYGVTGWRIGWIVKAARRQAAAA